MKKIFLPITISILFSNSILTAQNLYYPPIDTSENWETLNPETLGWCSDRINSLYTFLEQENTKGFIVLKDGKIVLEKYFGTFNAQSQWYWASAGKTVTSFLVGKAQEENYLKISDKTSKYLGEGWTNCSLTQENNITIENQLTMTTGLDDGVTDNHCTLNTCLNFLAPSGTRWAYHNAPYTLLEGVLENATSQPINTYTQLKLKNPTGMNGSWVTIDYDNVFFSTVRSMARFGLLIQGKGIWNGTKVINDTSYFNQMISTSQSINNSYGYLWWLNGKSSFMVPTSQFVFSGSYAPDAPADMFAGIGKNSQIVSISPSQGLVIIRMGDVPSSSATEVPFLFCNQIWQKINELNCNLSVIEKNKSSIIISPNPAKNSIFISNLTNDDYTVQISNLLGTKIMHSNNSDTIDISKFPIGIYIISVRQGDKTYSKKFIKN